MYSENSNQEIIRKADSIPDLLKMQRTVIYHVAEVTHSTEINDVSDAEDTCDDSYKSRNTMNRLDLHDSSIQTKLLHPLNVTYLRSNDHKHRCMSNKVYQQDNTDMQTEDLIEINVQPL